MEKVECPHCEKFVEIEPTGREHYSGSCEYDCKNCGKEFTVYAEPTIDYRTEI